MLLLTTELLVKTADVRKAATLLALTKMKTVSWTMESLDLVVHRLNPDHVVEVVKTTKSIAYRNVILVEIVQSTDTAVARPDAIVKITTMESWRGLNVLPSKTKAVIVHGIVKTRIASGLDVIVVSHQRSQGRSLTVTIVHLAETALPKRRSTCPPSLVSSRLKTVQSFSKQKSRRPQHVRRGPI